jgi:hypothetical protein
MESGETFPVFAMKCARAFGACVTLREEDPNAPIPDKFEPSDYSVKRLAEAERELKRLSKKTPAQQRAFGAKAKKADVARHKKWLAQRREEDARLDEMTKQVNAWTPPSPDHQEMKKFMLEQLRISRNGGYWDDEVRKAESKPALDYYTNALASAARDIAYHREEIEKERSRVEARNRWIQQLRASLPAT